MYTVVLLFLLPSLFPLIHLRPSIRPSVCPSVCLLPQISLFQQFPQLKSCVRPAVEKAVQDLLLPVVDRSIKIALTTTEHIVKKVIKGADLIK